MFRLALISFMLVAVIISAQDNPNVIPTRFMVNSIIEYRNGDIKDGNNYKMVGIPGDTSISVSSIMTGKSLKDWMAFYDNGLDYYVPYSTENENDFIFNPGNAFWIISKFTLQLGPFSVKSVKLASNNTYSISLHKGWNLISNPFDKAINWSEVREKNNIQNDLIYYFRDGFYEIYSVKMEPVLGYYYYNRKELEKLVLPYPSSTNYKLTPNEYEQIRISAKSDYAESYAEVIFDNEFSDAVDNYDQVAPPENFISFGLQLQSNKNLSPFNLLSVNSLPVFNDGIEIPFRIVNKTNSDILLSIENNIGFAKNLSFAIIRKLTNTKEVFNNDLSLLISNVNQSEEFILIAGTQDYIEKYNFEQLPADYQLKQNYPNPFNPNTSIEYFIPADDFIELNVYNGLGEKVCELVKSFKNAGNYKAEFSSNNLPSGIYFYQLKTSAGILSKKMVLIK